MTQADTLAPRLLRLGRALALTRAIDEQGQREYMGAQTYWP